MTAENFILMPFISMPFNQPFRYKGNWWLKTMNPTLGAKKLRKFSTKAEKWEELIDEGAFILVPTFDKVATEGTFIAKYNLYAHEMGI